MNSHIPADFVEIVCPWCGEIQSVGIEIDLKGEFYLDCQVCCRPWKVILTHDEWGDTDIHVEQGGG